MRTNAFTLLEKLRKHYADDAESLSLLDKKEEALRTAINATKLKDYPEIKAVVKDSRERVHAINAVLLNQSELDEKTRYGLLCERDAHEFYLARLSAERAVVSIKSFEAYLEKQLAPFEKGG